MALANRLAIIAGGIGGIGSATGKLLRSQGAKLALLYAPFEHDKVQPVLKEVYGGDDNGQIRAYACDVTSASSVEQSFKAIAQDRVAFPSMLINAAGYVRLSPLEETPPEDVMKHYAINLYGPTLTGQAFARLYFESSGFMRMAVEQDDAEAKSAKLPGGRIVNIASQAGHVALHAHGAYCASKAGLLGLTRSMASEWGSRGITANSVSPGPVWTVLGKKAWSDQKAREDYQAAVPTGKFAEPEEVAQAISYLCQDTSLNINGTDIRIDGGFTAR